MSEIEAFNAFREYVGADYATQDDFDEAYQGEHDSEEAFAQDFAQDIGAVTGDEDWPYTHIAWDRAAQDLFEGDYYSVATGNGTVYVFRTI